MKNLYKYLVSISIATFSIIFLFNEVKAATVTIGAGTSNQRQPFGMYYGYERSAAIYTSAEIGGTGSITSLAYDVATSQTASASVTIYLATTTATTLTAGTWATAISGATSVYTGTLSFSSTGWKTITLSTPFNYTGNNLLVLVQTNYGGTGTSSYPYFYYTSSTSHHEYWAQDNTAPTGSGTVNSNRPNIQITYSSTCVTPTTQATTVSFSNSCYTADTIKWTRGSGDGCSVFMYQGNSGTAVPVDGTTYTANAAFGSGTQIGSSGWYCVYSGTGSSVVVSGLTASTAYRVHVCEYTCTGTNTKYNVTSSTNNPNNTTTSTTPCYCTAGATTCDEYISNVTVGSINNSTSCTSGGYADYTAQSTVMTIGTGYAITVTNGNGYTSDQCGIWVDWNHNGSFTDANEVITVTGTSGVGPYTATITPPVGALTGSTRMRIRITYTGTLSSCGSVTYGEVEDYTLNVQSGSCTTPGIPVSATGTATGTTTAGLSWAAGTPAGSATVSYYWVVGKSDTVTYGHGIDQGITTSTSVTSAALTCNTSYYLRVYAFTSCNSTKSSYATSSLFTTNACPAIPANDQCSGAIAVTCGSSTSGTTVGATTTNDPTAACGVTITSPGVWYSFVGTGQDITVSFCGSVLPTSLNVYSGTCSSLTCIGGNEGNYTSCGDNNAYYTFTSVNGTTYYFFVHGIGTATGTFTMNVSCTTVAIPNCPTPTIPANGAINVGTPASLNWTAPTSGGTVSYYKLYFGTNNPPTNIYNGLNIGNVLTYSLTMNPSTTYYWKVTAVNGAGESSGCSIQHFTTSAATILVVDTSTYNPTHLVTNYLISGCLEAQNITFKGRTAQIGYFTGGNSTVGYDKGLVLSTGKAKDAEGPNSAANNSTDFKETGDATIASMIGVSTSTTHDASVLEFDFKPSSNTVSFRYTFGSEEYNEYVNTAYNDAFGFFLSGGPQNYSNKNIALIPGTSTPVSINNVNNGYAAAGSLGPGPGTNSAYYRDNATGTMNIECDGLTTVLTATATVTACQWYHIKLAIADVNDGIYDSWVFLEANSFSSGSGVAMNVANPTGDKNSYEGCTSSITFTRLDTVNTSSPLSISYTMGGTATSGTDYTALPNPVTIPAGVISTTIPLNTIKDNITEGTETIIFNVISGGCPCNPNISRDTIFLHDFVGVNGYIKEPDTTICQGKPVTLHGIVTAGNYYKCTWTNGSTFISHNQNITVTPSSTTTYTFNITDSCGNTINKNETITVDPPVSAPTLVTVDHSSYCFGVYSTITLSATGGSGATLSWFTGSCGGTFIGTGSSLTITAPTITTTYYAGWSNVGCGLSTCTPVTVTVNPLPIANAGIDVTINNGTDTILYGSATGGTGNYNYSWTPAGLLVNPNVQNPTTALLSTATVYTLLVTDPTTGCTSTDQVVVHVKGGAFTDTVTTLASAICLGDSTQINVLASGGSGHYSYLWYSNPSGFADTLSNPFVRPDTTTIYTVIVTDGFKKDTSSVTVIVHPLPVKFNITGTGSYCDNVAGIPVCISGSETGINYQLVSNGTNIGTQVAGTGSSICFGTQPVGIYSVVATNAITGCRDTMSGITTITINPTPNKYNVNVIGSGTYCALSPGVTVELSNSDIGINYELFVGSSTTGIIKPGTGSVIDYGNQPAGIYTIIATNTTTGCKDTMTGSATVIVNPLPNKYNVTVLGSGAYCSSDPGVTIELSNSEVGINYELFNGSASTSIIIAGTGSAIDFVNQPAGNYLIIATNTVTGCKDTMTGSATIIVNPIPKAYNITASGGGAYCASSPGVTLGLSGSEVGVSYELYKGGTSTVTTATGTGNAITFPGTYTAGIYTVIATNTTTQCKNYMTGSVTVIINPLPTAFNITGSGSYCDNAAGVPVCLSGSETGVSYQLDSNNTNIGSPVAGTGSSICFGNQPSGTYTVVATNTTTSCVNTMNGTAKISIFPIPLANAGPDVSICEGSQTTLIASAGVSYTYSWSPSTGLSSTTGASVIANPTSTTTYTVTVTDANTCTGTDEVVVKVNDNPVVSISSNLYDNIGYVGSNVIFTANPSTYDSYQFSVGNIVVVPNGPYIYQTNTLSGEQVVSVIAENNNCHSPADSIVIDIKPIPNAFIPNDDNVENAVFLKGLNIKILNRWGELLYEGTDGWDGKDKGNLVSAGTYFYIVTLTDSNNSSKELKGAVTVIIKK